MGVRLGDAILYLKREDSDLKRGLSQSERDVQSWASRLGGFVSHALSTATGVLIANAFQRIGRAAIQSGRDALMAYADYERLGMSLQSLVARELAKGTEKIVKIGEALKGLTEEQQEEYDKLSTKIQKLSLDRETLTARMADEQRKHQALIEQYGAESTQVALHAAQMDELAFQYKSAGEEVDQMKAKLAELDQEASQLVDVTERVVEGQMSMEEAMEKAGPVAKDLIDWIQKLALLSPFDAAGVSDAFRTAMAYGFVSDEAKRMTEAMINFAAGSGSSTDAMFRVALALGQIKAKGKLMAQELNQLTEAGLDARGILADAFGVTTAELEKMMEKGLGADQVIEAIVSRMEKDFAGAALKQATSFSGLLSSIKELKEVGLREFFTGTFQAAQPYVAAIVDKLASPEFIASVREVGDHLGQWVGKILEFVSQLIEGEDPLQALKDTFGDLIPDPVLKAIDAVSTFLTTDLPNAVGTVKGLFDPIKTEAKNIFNLLFKGDFTGLFGLAEDHPIVSTILGIRDTVLEAASSVSDFLAPAWMGFGVALEEHDPGPFLAGLDIVLRRIFGNEIMDGITALGGTFAKFGAWIVENGPVILAAVITAFILIRDTIFSVVDTIVNAIWPALKDAFDELTGILNDLGLEWSDVWRALGVGLKVVASIIGAIILGLIAVIVGLVTAVARAIRAIVENWRSMVTHIKGIVAGFMQFFVGIAEFFKRLIKGDFIGALEALKIAALGIWEVIKNAALLAWDSIRGTFNLIISFIGGFIEGVVGFFQNLYDRLVGRSIITDLVNEILRLFKSINLLEIGRNMIQGFINGINEKKEELKAKIRELAEGLPDWMKEPLNMHSPSLVFAKIGQNMMAGLAQGLADALPLATGQLRLGAGHLAAAGAAAAPIINLYGMQFPNTQREADDGLFRIWHAGKVKGVF